MPTSCPACSEALSSPNTQNFCTTCGEPINREADREFMRSNADGFLWDQLRKQLADTISGERDHRSEYTAMQVQEQARKALLDFRFVHQWNGIENGDVFFADVDAELDWDPEDPGELALQLNAMIELLSLIYANTRNVLTLLLEMTIALEEDVESGDEIDVQFLINGDQIGEMQAYTVPEDWDGQ